MTEYGQIVSSVFFCRDEEQKEETGNKTIVSLLEHSRNGRQIFPRRVMFKIL